MDQRAKSVSNKRASEGDDNIPEILENLEESEDEDDDNFEVEDEFDENEVSHPTQEPTDLKEKTVSHATAVWEHYKPRLLTNGARVAYLCSPNPTLIAHSEAHKDPLNNIAVEEFIWRVILPRKQTNSGDPNVHWQSWLTSFGQRERTLSSVEDSLVGRAFGLLQGTRRPFPMSGTSGTRFLLPRSLAFVPV
jgi:hypothetical protein